jgi:hypothetical protein
MIKSKPIIDHGPAFGGIDRCISGPRRVLVVPPCQLPPQDPEHVIARASISKCLKQFIFAKRRFILSCILKRALKPFWARSHPG